MAKVYRAIEIQLKDGVRPEDFEEFMVEEWASLPRSRKGFTYFGLLKGDKGHGKGQYQVVYVWDSVEARDLYDAGQLPDTADQQILKARAALQEKFGTMATGQLTDYVVVGR